MSEQITVDRILDWASAEAGPYCCDEEYHRLESIMRAAPDLLEALEAANLLLRTQRHACESTVVCHMLDSHIKRNNSAIAKARGEPS